MRHLYRYMILVCAVLAGALDAFAQIEEKIDTTDFDATQYSMQKRYRGRSERFVSSPFHDNTFITIYGGTAQMFDEAGTSYSMNPSAGFRLGKWFDDASGLSAGVAWRNYRRNLDDVWVMSHAAEISYLYNMTSFKYGYSSAHFCDVLLVSGLGFLANETSAQMAYGADVHLGLQVVMRVFDQVDLFLEPLGRFEYMFSDSDRFRFSYSINMGLTYNYISKRSTMPKTDFRKDRFVSLAGGANFQIADLTFENVDFLKSLGPHASLSYGRWYSGLFGLRISAFYENDTWNNYLNERPVDCHYFGGRIEGMFEFLHFIPGYERRRVPMTFSVLLGPEIGGMFKEDIHDQVQTSYIGATAALQYKCGIAGPVSIFIEPRMSFLPYNYKSTGQLNTRYTNYMDMVFNLSLGLEYAF